MTYQNSASESEREREQEQESVREPVPQLQQEPRLRRIVNLTIEIPTEIIQPLITGIRRNSELVKLVSMF
jgi:hypothetical protein